MSRPPSQPPVGVQTTKSPRSRTSVPVDRSILLELLIAHFNESELRTLCFELDDVEYDVLPPGGRSDKARELITYLERRGRLSELVEWGNRERPDVPWKDALQAPDKDPSTSQTVPPERLQLN